MVKSVVSASGMDGCVRATSNPPSPHQSGAQAAGRLRRPLGQAYRDLTLLPPDYWRRLLMARHNAVRVKHCLITVGSTMLVVFASAWCREYRPRHHDMFRGSAK